VYLHTPGKGTWYRGVTINLLAGPTLAFPNDPIVVIAKPQEGMNITQKQKNNKITFSGIALDRNPLSSVQGSLAVLPAGIGQVTGAGCPGCSGANGAIATQFRGAGIANITPYIDAPTAKGDNTTFGNFGAVCVGCVQGNTILVSNAGALNTPGKPQGSIISRQWGSAYDFSGWALSINPTTLSVGPHTLYVSAVSSITGKTSTAWVHFNILPYLQNGKIMP
jgi:hypothetical protein